MPLQGFACSRCKRVLHITVQVMATGCEVCHDYTAEIYRPPYLDSPYQPFINLPNSPQSLSYGNSIQLTVWPLSALSLTLIHSDISGEQSFSNLPNSPQTLNYEYAQCSGYPPLLLYMAGWSPCIVCRPALDSVPCNPPSQPLTDLLRADRA